MSCAPDPVSKNCPNFAAVREAACDAVDGARSRQRGPIRVIVVNESHQGAETQRAFINCDISVLHRCLNGNGDQYGNDASKGESLG